MDSLIDRGHRLLNRAMQPAAATSVLYTRGATVVSESLAATLSNQQIEQVTAGGAAIVGRQFTWRLKRDQLVIDGQPVTPQKFDRVVWNHGGRLYAFIVSQETGAPESAAVDPRSDWIPASAKLSEVT